MIAQKEELEPKYADRIKYYILMPFVRVGRIMISFPITALSSKINIWNFKIFAPFCYYYAFRYDFHQVVWTIFPCMLVYKFRNL